MRVSVGLPVFNEADNLERVVANMQSQSFKDIEIIISDNASTDRTPEIARALCRSCANVRYVRLDENVGPVRNFARVHAEAKGTYFMWAAADDLHDPRFIETLVCVLDDNPTVVAAMSDVRQISVDDGHEMTRTLQPIRLGMQLDRAETCKVFFQYPTSNVFLAIYGLYRREAIASAVRNMGRRNFVMSTEVPFLAEVSLRGRIVSIPETLFMYHQSAHSVSSRARKGEKSLLSRAGKHAGIVRALYAIALTDPHAGTMRLALLGTLSGSIIRRAIWRMVLSPLHRLRPSQ